MRAEAWERYRALVERSADVIFVLDEHGVVQYVNATGEERIGYPADQLVGTSSLDLIHPDDRSRAVESLHRALGAAPGPQDPFFARVRHADGRWSPVELVGNNLTTDDDVRGHVLIMRDIADRARLDALLAETEATYRRSRRCAERADGMPDGAVALVTEITEQRTIEEQLRYNETRLTTLFEVSSDIMAILEPDGTWHASPRARESSDTRSAGTPRAASCRSCTPTTWSSPRRAWARCWTAPGRSTSRSACACATSTATTCGSTARPRTRSTTRPCAA